MLLTRIGKHILQYPSRRFIMGMGQHVNLMKYSSVGEGYGKYVLRNDPNQNQNNNNNNSSGGNNDGSNPNNNNNDKNPKDNSWKTRL